MMLKDLRSAWSGLLKRSWLGAGVPALFQAGALAQEQQIEEVLVVGESQSDYLVDELSQEKFTESLRDTPQSITTLSAGLLADRAAMSLNDALRNVPGITLGAGEFSWQGNNPSIRGFNSRNDMFMDGMRDFGSYYRDPFNLDSVEVLQGPSSVIFGRGSTGGVINQVSKIPVPDPLRRLHINAGNAATRRITADVNQPFSLLGQRAAVRINLLDHKGEVAGRDQARSERAGIAPSLFIEVGPDSELVLSHLHQDAESVPDYGLPWIAGEPAPVSRDSYYGFRDDFIDTETDVTSLTLNHQLSANARFNFQLRYADYTRDSRISEPQLLASTDPQVDPRIGRFVFRGESTESMLQGQLNALFSFDTGAMSHKIVVGWEASSEDSSPSFGFGENVPGTSLFNPVAGEFSGATPVALDADTDASSAAVYLLDTIQLSQRWQLMAGVRRDRFATDYAERRFESAGTLLAQNRIRSTDAETSYRLALIYKPAESLTWYAGLGTSFNPSTEGLSQISSGRNLTVSNVNLEPEENRSTEVGVKWELGSGLLLDAALFNIEKTNARVPDPNNPGFNLLAGEQRVRGYAVNINGMLSERWQVAGGYTYLDSAQEETLQVNVPADSPLQNVAEHNFSLWVYYDTPIGLHMGAGARFVDDRRATITLPGKAVDGYWSFDAMAKYSINENLTLKLNLTNLADEYYFDQLHPWHVIPGPGFASVFALNLDY